MFIHRLTLLVKDIDSALRFYQTAFDFQIIEDTWINDWKRITRISPPAQPKFSFHLAPANTDTDKNIIGRQGGSRALAILEVSSMVGFVERINQAKAKIVEGPTDREYGQVVLVEDLYGNKWEFIERKGLR